MVVLLSVKNMNYNRHNYILMFFLIKSDLLLLLNFFGCGQKHLHKSNRTLKTIIHIWALIYNKQSIKTKFT